MSSTLIELTLSGQTFIGTTGFVPTNTLSTVDVALLKNPSGSGKVGILTNTRIGSDPTGLANFSAHFYYSVCPVTSDDGQTIVSENMNIGQGSPTLEMYKLPTCSDPGNSVALSSISEANRSVGIDKIFVIRPGQQIVIRVDVNTEAPDIHVDFTWIEIDE